MKNIVSLPIAIGISLAASLSISAQSNIQQSLSINGDGTAPNTSAQLDVSATDKGMLVPRMTSAQRTFIASPATGLLVFDTTTGGFWFFNGTAWVDLSASKTLADADNDTKIQVEETPDEDIIRMDLAGSERLVLQQNAGGNTQLLLPANNQNIFIGDVAGSNNTTGIANTAVGDNAFLNNIGGHANVAVGVTALQNNLYGIDNVAVGVSALYANQNGNYNTANGEEALFSNTTGNSNVAIGGFALYQNTDRSNLVAVGDSALYNNGTGAAAAIDATANTALGSKALFANTIGFNNTANGNAALYSNTIGYDNTAIGRSALFGNTTGFGNTASGRSALYANTTGVYNTATGLNALQNNTSGQSNTATGAGALQSNTTGIFNTAVGVSALFANTTGRFNTAQGRDALLLNTTGEYNTASGFEALYANTVGDMNTAMGVNALRFNTTGFNNTAHGESALRSNTTGSFNTAVGRGAVNFTTTGVSNTGVGGGALNDNTTGHYNTAIGASAFFTVANLSNTACLGYFSGAVSNVSNRMEIGNTSVSFIGGQVGWSTYSDARIKTQVQENVPGLDFITKLRPVTYHLDIHRQNEMCFRGKKEIAEWDGKYDIEQKQMTGFIAQEVEQAAKAVGYDFSGVEKAADEVGLYSVRYSDFVVPLVKGMQEQQAIIEAQAAENQVLKVQVEMLYSQLAKFTAALQGAGIVVEK